MKYRYKVQKADSSKAGKLAGRKQTFGDCCRFAVAPVHTRFGNLNWFVWDASMIDALGYSAVVRQEETLEEAVAGLV